MKNLFLMMFILIIGCQATGKQNKTITCKLKSPITNPESASKALITCYGSPSFEAKCDFSADPLEVKTGFFEPKDLIWMKYGANEGVEFKSTDTSGFIVCKKLRSQH